LQREIELSKQHHASDLQEKNRLSRMLEHKVVCYFMSLLIVSTTVQLAPVCYIFNL
jgi:hypothetical protein